MSLYTVHMRAPCNSCGSYKFLAYYAYITLATPLSLTRVKYTLHTIFTSLTLDLSREPWACGLSLPQLIRATAQACAKIVYFARPLVGLRLQWARRRSAA